MTTPTVAANAYAALAKLHDPTAAAKGVTAAPSGGAATSRRHVLEETRWPLR